MPPWRQLDDERREERYRAAYRTQPESTHDGDWADMAADELLVSDQGDCTATVPTPPATPGRKRRAAS